MPINIAVQSRPIVFYFNLSTVFSEANTCLSDNLIWIFGNQIFIVSSIWFRYCEDQTNKKTIITTYTTCRVSWDLY